MRSFVERRRAWVFCALFLVLLTLLILDVVLGSVWLPLGEVWGALLGDSVSDVARSIVVGYRLPKALTALMAGVGLSVSGLLMQTTFRNPLAGPYLLGISSGASLGAAVAILAVGSVAASAVSVALASWVGALCMLLLVLLVALRQRSMHTVLIFGVMVGAAAGAGVSMLQYVSDVHALKRFTLWALGNLSNITGDSLAMLSLATLVGVCLAFACVRPLDLLLLGSTAAGRLGLSLRWSRVLVFGATTLLAGTVTAYCGPIGFIGIAVPHIARWSIGSSLHGPLLLATILLGGCSMVATDIISQLPGTEATLPVNAVASLLGVPVVVRVLFQRSKRV